MKRSATGLLLPILLSTALATPLAARAPGDCDAENARDNHSWPLKMGTDFVPLTSDDSLGFYVVYSARTTNGTTMNNNVGMFVFEIDGGELVLFGAGYGDTFAALNSAHFDAANMDAMLRNCMGRVPESTPIRFVSPHWHGDHINVEFIHELQALGWPIVDIVFHEDDAPFIYNYYNWTWEDETKFTLLSDGACSEEIASYSSPLGKLWFTARSGHAPGAIDAVIDVRGNTQDRFAILGSAPGGACNSLPPGTRNFIKGHGNVLLSTDPQVVPYGCGINPDGSLTVLNGAPRIGAEVVLGVDDPEGDVAVGSLPYLWVSTAPDALVPCGSILSLPGMARQGELLLGDDNSSFLAPPRIGAPWAGAGTPSPFLVDLPYDTALVGKSIFYQGAIIDPLGTNGNRIALTEALELRLGQ